jgi:hypothetical protein
VGGEARQQIGIKGNWGVISGGEAEAMDSHIEIRGALFR